jgi:hypothetical protein
MADLDDLRKQLACLDAEIDQIGRDCEAAELYGDIGPRYQRMLRRVADLQRERALLLEQLAD